MPRMLTIENLPDDVYERLKLSAQLHCRSMGSETIACLQAVLMPATPTLNTRLARAKSDAVHCSRKFFKRTILTH